MNTITNRKQTAMGQNGHKWLQDL